jgi:hypothetical protein
MDNVFRRYEKKFLLTSEQFEQLLPIIREHMDQDPYCLEGEPYLVRTIYLDTDDNEIIRRSLDKPKYKEKLRMRKYGPLDSVSDSIYLEIKRKYKGIGNKRRVKLTINEAIDLIEKGTIPARDDYYSMQILNEIAYHLKQFHVLPSVFISYRRLAYNDSEDPKFRLTIDHELLTRRVDLAFDKPLGGLALLKPGYRLMEVKIGKAMPLWFAKALSSHKIYLTSFSKYGKEFEARIQKELAIDEYI